MFHPYSGAESVMITTIRLTQSRIGTALCDQWVPTPQDSLSVRYLCDRRKNRAKPGNKCLETPGYTGCERHKIYQNHGHPLFFRGRGWVVQDYARPADELTAVVVSVAYTPALHPYEEYWRERVQAPSESVISIIIYRETLKRSHGSA